MGAQNRVLGNTQVRTKIIIPLLTKIKLNAEFKSLGK